VQVQGCGGCPLYTNTYLFPGRFNGRDLDKAQWSFETYCRDSRVCGHVDGLSMEEKSCLCGSITEIEIQDCVIQNTCSR
jgi:hypothetical protein